MINDQLVALFIFDYDDVQIIGQRFIEPVVDYKLNNSARLGLLPRAVFALFVVVTFYFEMKDARCTAHSINDFFPSTKLVIFKSTMKGKTFIQKIRQQARPAAIASWQFLKAIFSDKKNIGRFALATVAIVVAYQLFPEGKIEIAGFGVAAFIVLTFIALMIAAPYALAKMKLPFNLYTYGIFQWISSSMLLVLYDWVLWYFETENALWVMAYCLIIAVFNCIIEDLMKDDNH
jgi:uncharacterized membrane protein YvlD (DUF360 family)